mgnify:CR=1 FL=1
MPALLIFLALLLLSPHTSVHADVRTEVRRMCESIAANAEAFAYERKKGYTKNQIKDNARQIANQRELEPPALDAWYAEIDWLFKFPNLRLGPVGLRDRRFEECMKQHYPK